MEGGGSGEGITDGAAASSTASSSSTASASAGVVLTPPSLRVVVVQAPLAPLSLSLVGDAARANAGLMQHVKLQ